MWWLIFSSRIFIIIIIERVQTSVQALSTHRSGCWFLPKDAGVVLQLNTTFLPKSLGFSHESVSGVMIPLTHRGGGWGGSRRVTAVPCQNPEGPHPVPVPRSGCVYLCRLIWLPERFHVSLSVGLAAYGAAKQNLSFHNQPLQPQDWPCLWLHPWSRCCIWCLSIGQHTASGEIISDTAADFV